MVRITFNNHRSNRDSKNQKSMSLNIDNCKITNYDPDKKTPQGSGDLTLSIVDGKKNYKRGNSLFNNSDVELNETKYSIFERLAIQDGKSNDLTEEDISLAKRNFRKGCTLWQLGVINIDYNPNDGKAVINIKGDEVLYIDFETKKERQARINNKKTPAATQNTTQPQIDETKIKNKLCQLARKKKPEELTIGDFQRIRDNSLAELTKLGVTRIAIDDKAGIVNLYGQDPKKPLFGFNFKVNSSKPTQSNSTTTNTTTATDGQFAFHKQHLDAIARIMGISTSKLMKEIKKIANDTGVSERLVMNIISTEGFIRKAKDIGDGEITVGFGHTKHANHNTKFNKGYSITNKTAFVWLKQDIIDKRDEAKKYFSDGINWNEIPLSIRDAIIDIAFNRGAEAMSKEEVYRSLRANLKEGSSNDPASAVRTRQEFKSKPEDRTSIQVGLMKRNCYRFLMAIQDLTPKEQLIAIKRFKMANNHGEDYYASTLKLLKKYGYNTDANTLQKDWEQVERDAKNAVK